MLDLDGKDKPTLEVSLSGKEFKIKRVVSGVYQRYGDFAKESGKALKLVSDLQGKFDEGVEGLDEEVIKMTTLTEEIAEMRETMERESITLILEKNGYEMDWEWWMENTDTYDRQAFIVECLNKDHKTGGSGKKKQES